MRLTRLIAGTVTAGLLSLVPIALTAPAAQANVVPEIEIQSTYSKVPYGQETTISGRIRATDNTGYFGYVNVGQVTLQSKVTGKGWKNVRTLTSGVGSPWFSGIKPKEHTEYRLAHSGGTTPNGTVVLASTSKSVKVKVSRTITGKAKNGSLVMQGKVTPKYKNKKIVIKSSKKKNKGFKKVMTIKTNKKGRYKVRLPRRKGTVYYKFIVKKDKRFSGVTGTTNTWSY